MAYFTLRTHQTLKESSVKLVSLAAYEPRGVESLFYTDRKPVSSGETLTLGQGLGGVAQSRFCDDMTTQTCLAEELQPRNSDASIIDLT